MDIAINQGREALTRGELPIGAVLVLDAEVIAAGHNWVIGHGDLLAHAEMMVLSAAKSKLKALKIDARRRAVLYSTLEPCLMCCGAAMNLNLGSICYAHSSPGDGVMPHIEAWHKRANQLPQYRPPAVISGIRRKESRILFREFANSHPGSRFSTWTRQLSEYED